jgi:glycosyltransferase involved in cell wall biosynthesis
MKILVFAHQLEVGGTQVNAIELAAALRDFHGHDVVVFASPGPMVKLVHQKNLKYVPAPVARLHPSPARMQALRDVVRQERPDVVHAWDWWQGLDAYFGVHLPQRMPLVVSDMCMELNTLLPKTPPTTFGIPELVDQARARGRKRAELLLPPVDVQWNAPGVVDARQFRERNGIGPREVLLVTVSRLAEWLKGESLQRTIDAVRVLGRRLPLRLVIVGDGTMRPKLQQLAEAANAELGRSAVTLPGALLDPREAYAAADVVVGMGGSSLRGLAFGKPVIVVGERGFSAAFTPQTAQSFYYKGFYGIGDGQSDNVRLIEDIKALVEHPHQLPALGKFSREFVVKHFSLEAGSAALSALCHKAVSEPVGLGAGVADGIRTMAIWVKERRFVPGLKAFVPETEASSPRANAAPEPS